MPRHMEKLMRALLQYRVANIPKTTNPKIMNYTHTGKWQWNTSPNVSVPINVASYSTNNNVHKQVF